ncbi:unnamed protein product [Allacma fusca]|uniref:Uncharacterized protein n=1 Tax=Allacma fusca TaxID=39272 RepID=A0A8J2LRM6_9HEXA|nr:unnamed protein product [Allacma fusca]
MESLDWTNIALVGFIFFVTIILLIVFCRWLRRDNEEQAYRNELERRRQGFYMLQDPGNTQGIWEVWTMEDAREMQDMSPSSGPNQSESQPSQPDTVLSPMQFYAARRLSNPRAKRIGSNRLESILE